MRDISRASAAFSAAKFRPSEIFLYDITDSTNERARKYPAEVSAGEKIELDSASDASLFIANSQTAGRGRLGRSFVSNPDSGLYMSIRIPLDIPLSEAVGITPLAAVAVCRAIERLCPLKPEIKWVNDIFAGGKKLAGILTESTAASNGRRCFIVGIGINISPSDMPAEVAAIAASLADFGATADKYELAAAICDEFLGNITEIWNKGIIEEYKSLSCLVGKEVAVSSGNDVYPAKVLGITDRYELRVLHPDGTERYLSAGEVSSVKPTRR